MDFERQQLVGVSHRDVASQAGEVAPGRQTDGLRGDVRAVQNYQGLILDLE